jgi:hypothetical protein
MRPAPNAYDDDGITYHDISPDNDYDEFSAAVGTNFLTMHWVRIPILLFLLLLLALCV